ncbi:histidine phosphatase family protein [Halobacillus sp. Marseille-P3879]|uniref:histidine phosphatase family protein n=1 Tax=Halobacillus sp. Marseille-P3879 TaxID=2045014 RepID=UPI00190E9A5F|nr:histidine phosphatase family protein [Halobacillus sp. Marseille-P3879]
MRYEEHLTCPPRPSLHHYPTSQSWSCGIVDCRQSLLSSLREGGYILYVRHAEATAGEDTPMLNFSDCSTQRNLSNTGRNQAAAYGQTLRRLRIPVSLPVFASPFCRSRETAFLAFSEENVYTDPFWFHVYLLSADLSDYEKASIINSLTSRLELPPPEGTNTVIIAHSFPEGVGLGPISNMGTVVVKPLGEGNGFEVTGRLSLQEFMNL